MHRKYRRNISIQRGMSGAEHLHPIFRLYCDALTYDTHRTDFKNIFIDSSKFDAFPILRCNTEPLF